MSPLRNEKGGGTDIPTLFTIAGVAGVILYVALMTSASIVWALKTLLEFFEWGLFR